MAYYSMTWEMGAWHWRAVASETAVHFLQFGHSLTEDTRFTAFAAIADRPQPLLHQLQSAISAYLLGDDQPLALIPVAPRGTAFQQTVWQALQAIPVGHTFSYSGLAQYIGQPEAVRAVAGACAANPIALRIPCHRVVAKNGQMRGYRWGVAAKQQLLHDERQRRVA